MARYGMTVEERNITRQLNYINQRIRECKLEKTRVNLLKKKTEVLDLREYVRNLRK